MRLISAIFLLLISSISCAAECPKDISELPDGEQWCLVEELTETVKKADKELDLQYKLLLGTISNNLDEHAYDAWNDPEGLLIQGQRAWLKYYQSDCSALRDFLTVGNQPTRSVIALECQINRIRQRISELKEHCKFAFCKP